MLYVVLLWYYKVKNTKAELRSEKCKAYQQIKKRSEMFWFQ